MILFSNHIYCVFPFTRDSAQRTESRVTRIIKTFIIKITRIVMHNTNETIKVIKTENKKGEV